MPDDRNKMQGQQGDMDKGQQGGAHQSPGRNPQDDKSAGGQQGVQDMNRQGRQGDDGDAYKEGRQNEQTRR